MYNRRNKGESMNNETNNEVDINETTNVSEAQDQFQPNPLTRREMKYLKKNRYFDIKDNPSYKDFILFNKKTGQMVEIKASSSFHACKIIGWKPNQVTLIPREAIETAATTEAPETAGSSNV